MGWSSVAWGLAHISSQELLEWEAYYLLEPFGFEMDNYRHGANMSLLANVNRDTDVEPFSPDLFMYEYDKVLESKDEVEDEKPMSEDDIMKAKAQFWTQAMGA